MTELEVCNWALLKIGLTPLKDFSEGGVKADYCQRLLRPLHQSLLRSFAWSFATKTACLSALDPTVGEEDRYGLPNKCLKVLKIDRVGALEGDCIVVKVRSSRPLAIKYIEEVSLEDCDPLYQEAFALKLASELCPPLISDDQLRSYLKGESDRVLATAIDMDGIEIPEERSYQDG
ncbi:hypothetical protein HUT03_02120 [Candidatus Liberibacter africanus]|uniref:hypothetical protein n=1 Tax=Liberibacter africanus TaxID=34020 RepID=UPI001AE71061|nr:hypothetical protein [Candidatus Liberibacter africanus]QTP63881.1 hypothetical protein HUT03_02120 [Candidatus Liberibacter africanus]